MGSEDSALQHIHSFSGSSIECDVQAKGHENNGCYDYHIDDNKDEDEGRFMKAKDAHSTM